MNIYWICQVVSRVDSLVGESTFQKWPLKDSSSHNASVSDQLLGMLTKNQRPTLDLDCSGCQDRLKKLDDTTIEDETSAIWNEICATSEEILETEKRMERNKLKKIKVKIVCCIGDILQGSSLMILMLRRDLRIRGLLSLTKMATNIRVDPSK